MILYTLLVMSILFSSVAVSALTSSKDLETRGSPKHLHVVFNAIVLSRITYCICAWYGFLSREHIGRFDAFLKRMFNYGYCQQLYTLSGLCKQYDKTLSKIILNSQSCIHQLLPSESSSHMQLKPRAHNFTLPICKTVWYKNSFVNRFLFSNVYQLCFFSIS